MIKISIGISTLANNKSKAFDLANSIRKNDVRYLIDDIVVMSQGELEDSVYTLGHNILVHEKVEKGLSKSRNALLTTLKSDYVWLIDDDVTITTNNLDTIYATLKEYPEYDLLIGKIGCADNEELFKRYNKRSGYRGVLSVSSIEMIINKRFLFEKNIFFNNNLGLGARYPCGEENELLIKCLNKGASIKFLDQVFILHPSLSSLDKSDYFSTKEQIIAKKIIAKVLPFRYKFFYIGKVIVYLAIYKRSLSLFWCFINPFDGGILK
jgi:hypothetical protein